MWSRLRLAFRVEPLLYGVFLSGLVIWIAEFFVTYNSTFFIARALQGSAAFVLFFLVPYIYIFAARGSYETWNVRRIAFHGFSWFFFALSLYIFVGVISGSLKWLSESGSVLIPTVTASFVLGSVLAISGMFASGSAFDDEVLTDSTLALDDNTPAVANADALGTATGKSNGESPTDKRMRVFFSMNVMLTIAAAILAGLAEVNWNRRGNQRVALIEGAFSVIIFAAAMFNTHGLGGRLTNSQNAQWSFYQPFVGGAKFVTLQIMSWMFFGFSLAR